MDHPHQPPYQQQNQPLLRTPSPLPAPIAPPGMPLIPQQVQQQPQKQSGSLNNQQPLLQMSHKQQQEPVLSCLNEMDRLLGNGGGSKDEQLFSQACQQNIEMSVFKFSTIESVIFAHIN